MMCIGNLFLFVLCKMLLFRQSTADCKDKYKIFPHHSACLQRSKDVRDSGPINKHEALNAHNKYRHEAARRYNGSNILKMIWDDEVALIAQKWADHCLTKHDKNYQRLIPGRFNVGQNIATSPYKMTWDAVVQLFYNESKDFTYGGNNDLEKVGHFTQLTWATSYILGCGHALCGGYHFYVCNYAPGGNSNGNLGKPFSIEGKSSKLIDCKNKICEGGSQLDPTSCSCVCNKDIDGHSLNFLTPDSDGCLLVCKTDIKEKFFCGTQDGFKQADCLRLGNMPFDCPKTCHVCPYADKKYKEGSSPVIRIEGYNGVSHTVIPCILLMFLTVFHIL